MTSRVLVTHVITTFLHFMRVSYKTVALSYHAHHGYEMYKQTLNAKLIIWSRSRGKQCCFMKGRVALGMDEGRQV